MLIDADNNKSFSYDDIKSLITSFKLQKSNPFVLLSCKTDYYTAINYLCCLLNDIPVLLFDSTKKDKLSNIVDTYKPNVIMEGDDVQYLSNDICINPINRVFLPTSGSTGSCKYVRLSRGNVFNNAVNIVRTLGIKKTDIALLNLPLHYSYGLSVLNTHLLKRANVILTGSSVLSNEYWDAIKKYNVNSISGVPYYYKMLRKFPKERFDSIEIMTQAGGKLSVDIIKHFRGCVNRFYVMYGQTEATARMCVLPYDNDNIETVGKPITNGKVFIEDGEIVYYGKNVMLGYANDYKDLVLGDINCGKLNTGDLGEWVGGCLKIVGRNNRYIKLFGSRVNLDDVQNMLGECIVSGVEDKIIIECEDSRFDIVNELMLKSFNKAAFQIKKVDKLNKTNWKI